MKWSPTFCSGTSQFTKHWGTLKRFACEVGECPHSNLAEGPQKAKGGTSTHTDRHTPFKKKSTGELRHLFKVNLYIDSLIFTLCTLWLNALSASPSVSLPLSLSPSLSLSLSLSPSLSLRATATHRGQIIFKDALAQQLCEQGGEQQRTHKHKLQKDERWCFSTTDRDFWVCYIASFISVYS